MDNIAEGQASIVANYNGNNIHEIKITDGNFDFISYLSDAENKEFNKKLIGGGSNKREQSKPNVMAEHVVRTFNTWAYKREQPSDLNLLLQIVTLSISLNAPIPFVFYWGKGPRSVLAAVDITCIEYLRSLAERIQQVYAPGAHMRMIFTDTHARLNGHSEEVIDAYFGAVETYAKSVGFSGVRLSHIVERIGDASRDEIHLDPLADDLREALNLTAQKWYGGVGRANEGAFAYYQANMVEKRAVELEHPCSIFASFNGSDFRALLPRRMPIFYMYSLKRGVSVKPWFISANIDPGQGE